MKSYIVEKRLVPSGTYNMKVLLLRPRGSIRSAQETPGVLWLHGGGYAVGMANAARRD